MRAALALSLIATLLVGCPSSPVTLSPSSVLAGGRQEVELCLPVGRDARSCALASLRSESQVGWSLEAFDDPSAGRCATVHLTIPEPGRWELPVDLCSDAGPFLLEVDGVAAAGQFAAEAEWGWFIGHGNRALNVPLVPWMGQGATAFAEIGGDWVEVPFEGRLIPWPEAIPGPTGRFRVEVTQPDRWIEFTVSAPTSPRGSVHAHRGPGDGRYFHPVDDETFEWTGPGITVEDGLLSYFRRHSSAEDRPEATATAINETPWGQVRGTGRFGLAMTKPPPPTSVTPTMLVSGDPLCPGEPATLHVQFPGASWLEAPSVSSSGLEVLEVTLLRPSIAAVAVQPSDEVNSLPSATLAVDGVSIPLQVGTVGYRNLHATMDSGWTLLRGREEPLTDGPTALLLPQTGGWWSEVTGDVLRYGLGAIVGVPRPALLRRGCSTTVERWTWSPAYYSGFPPTARMTFDPATSDPISDGIPQVAIVSAPEDVIGLTVERESETELQFTPQTNPEVQNPQLGTVIVDLEGTVGSLSFGIGTSGTGGWPDDCDQPWLASGEAGTWTLAGLPTDAAPDPDLDDRVLSAVFDGYLATLELSGPAGGGAPAIQLRSPSEGVTGVELCRPWDEGLLGVSALTIRPGAWTTVHVAFPIDEPPPSSLFVDGMGRGEVEVLDWPDPREVRLRVRPDDDVLSLTLRFAADERWWAAYIDTREWWRWPPEVASSR